MIDEASWEIQSPISMSSMAMPAGLPTQDVFTHINLNWNRLVRALTSARKDTQTIETTSRELCEDLDDKFQVLRASLGTKVAGGSAPALTAWDSIEVNTDWIQEHHEKFRHHLQAHEIRLSEAEGKVLDMITSRVQPLQNQVASIKDVVDKRVLPMLMKAVQFMEASVATGTGAAGSTIDSPSVRFHMSKQDQVLEAMESRVQILEVSGRSNVSPGGGTNEAVMSLTREVQILRAALLDVEDKLHVSAQPISDAVIQGINFDVKNLRDELAQVRRENQQLRSDQGNDGVSFGGYFFQSLKSYETFICTYHPSGSYNFCFDIISAIEASNFNSKGGDKKLTNLGLVEKTKKYDLENEAWIDSSFNVVVPDVFGAEKDKKNPGKKMGALETMESWDDPTSQSGMMWEIDNLMQTHRNNVESELTMLGQEVSTGIVQFYQTMAQEVNSFWEDLKAWIYKFERETLVPNTGDDMKTQKATVWHLICLKLHSMFVELNTRRAAGRAGASNKVTKYALILKGTLAAHKFMKELRAAQFSRHEIFGATFDKFLLNTKATGTHVASLDKRMAVLEGQGKAWQRATDKAAAAVKGPAKP